MKHLLLSVVLVATSFASAAEVADSPDANPVKALAGCYVASTAAGRESLLLQLGEDRTYTAMSLSPLGVWAKATGQWHLADGALYLGASHEAAGWHHYMQPIQISRGRTGTVLRVGSEVLASRYGSCGL